MGFKSVNVTLAAQDVFEIKLSKGGGVLWEHRPTWGTSTFLHTLSCLLFLTTCVSTEQGAEYLRMEFVKLFYSRAVFFSQCKGKLVCKI
jgi:hypothetical protein